MKHFTIMVLLSVITNTVFSQIDSIYTVSGNHARCKIIKEDSARVYFEMYNDKKQKIDTYLDKKDILRIQYGVKKPLTNSGINLGVGFGPSYGVIGTKMLIGKNNSGLIIGMGTTPLGKLTTNAGVQLSVKSVFVNFGYGAYGVIKPEDGPAEASYGMNINGGGMINLGKYRHWFLELALGLVLSRNNPSYFTNYEFFNSMGALGIGYRFESKN
ncbi:MAG: hypothetical protein JXB00_00965 [Bacteroidales bacterium]|nr:hypothetical protein [Bacteroidales bacterium]